MLEVVLNMSEHSSFQDMLFPMLFISKYAKSYASIMDINLIVKNLMIKTAPSSKLVLTLGKRQRKRVAAKTLDTNNLKRVKNRGEC